MWVEIHEIERQLASFLSPIEQVDVYLLWADAELRGLDRPGAIVIADAIRTALHTPLSPLDGERGAQERTRKALLGRALSIIHADRDTSFSTLMEWQNKASWLIFAALIAIVFLVAVAGNPALFLAGAAGGYLSRVMRALKREDVPLDYGASWTTLYLSPLFGALAGWFGLALITLVSNRQLNLLGDAFRMVRWDQPTMAITLAVAFLLGFSERFFDAVVGAVEQHAERDETARKVAMAAAPAVPNLDLDARRERAPGGVVAPGGIPFISAIELRGVATGDRD